MIKRSCYFSFEALESRVLLARLILPSGMTGERPPRPMAPIVPPLAPPFELGPVPPPAESAAISINAIEKYEEASDKAVAFRANTAREILRELIRMFAPEDTPHEETHGGGGAQRDEEVPRRRIQFKLLHQVQNEGGELRWCFIEDWQGDGSQAAKEKPE